MRSREQIVGLVGILVVLALVAVWPLFGEEPDAHLREVNFTVFMFVALASSLNILLGYTGYVSFGHIVFFGFGGYFGFWLLTVKGVPLPISILAGGAASGVLAFLLGKAILRLRGAYFALATIGVNQAMRAFINNFEPFGGATGLHMNFQVYNDYGGAMQALWLTYWTMVTITALVLIVSWIVKTSKFGLGLMAIRENEDAAEVMGVVTPNAKTWAYVLSAIFPGMIGVVFMFKNGTIEPEAAFRLHTSIEMIVMVMLGGFGTVLGPFVGAAGYQWLRRTLLTASLDLTPLLGGLLGKDEVMVKVTNFQLPIAGALLLMIILFVPAGALGWVREKLARYPEAREVVQ